MDKHSVRKSQIEKSRYLLILGDGPHQVLEVVKNLTGDALIPHPKNGISGLCHKWDLTTKYYNVTIGMWLDDIAKPGEWASTYREAKGKQVIAKVAAIIYCFPKPKKLKDQEAILAAMEAIGSVTKAWNSTSEKFAVAVSHVMHESPFEGVFSSSDWEQQCSVRDFGYIDLDPNSWLNQSTKLHSPPSDSASPPIPIHALCVPPAPPPSVASSPMPPMHMGSLITATNTAVAPTLAARAANAKPSQGQAFLPLNSEFDSRAKQGYQRLREVLDCVDWRDDDDLSDGLGEDDEDQQQQPLLAQQKGRSDDKSSDDDEPKKEVDEAAGKSRSSGSSNDTGSLNGSLENDNAASSISEDEAALNKPSASDDLQALTGRLESLLVKIQGIKEQASGMTGEEREQFVLSETLPLAKLLYPDET